MDSTGLKLLERTCQSLTDDQGGCSLTLQGVPDQIARLFDITGMDGTFKSR